MSNIHGDIIVKQAVDTSIASAAQHYDEYGNAISAAAGSTYGWLGASQRSAETLNGYLLMGVRVYDPTIGRFLQADSVYAGNSNSYIYPADPINTYDLDGRKVIKKYNKSGKSCGWTACTFKVTRYKAHNLADALNGASYLWGSASALIGAASIGFGLAAAIVAAIVASGSYLANWLAGRINTVLGNHPRRGIQIKIHYWGTIHVTYQR